jgi:regulator of replication initiation timing
MSTSPSWFDQEKFSRLVKKVGPKNVPEPAPAPTPTEQAEDRPVSGEVLASTARISLVSKPPSLLSENRALPALPRRTSTLPSLKALFPTPTPTRPTPAASQPLPATLPPKEEANDSFVGAPDGAGADEPAGADSASHFDEDGPLGEVWQKMGQLNEELARTIQERDQAVHDCEVLREQLEKTEAAPKDTEGALAVSEELSRVTEERDQARKQYADLRREFELLKLDQNPKEESGRARKDLEQQLDGFRQKLEERNREIAVMKTGALSSSGGGSEDVEKLRQQITSLREQLSRAKDEASVAQRGLALSQKALHETRDTLREATEGTSLSRHNFDNLKNECATLTQQNTVLQAQNDQLTRDLAAAKSKLTTRL